MEYTLDNVKCKYPKIVSSGTFDEIIKLLNTLDEKEQQLRVINTEKIKLELEVEALKIIINDFRSLIEITTKRDTVDSKKDKKEFSSQEPLTFGIISSGEGNTRIG